MQRLTDEQVGDARRRMEFYRVTSAQNIAAEGESDGISGALLLAIGLRETGLRNIEGGAKLVDGRYVAEDDPDRMDVGWLQISRRYHKDELGRMPGVCAGTWEPAIDRKNAADAGYCPTFTASTRYVLAGLQDAIKSAKEQGIQDPVRFAVAAHNAGVGGAMKGDSAGDVDKYTAGGDYSQWILATRTQVNQWLGKHPNWVAK